MNRTLHTFGFHPRCPVIEMSKNIQAVLQKLRSYAVEGGVQLAVQDLFKAVVTRGRVLTVEEKEEEAKRMASVELGLRLGFKRVIVSKETVMAQAKKKYAKDNGLEPEGLFTAPFEYIYEPLMTQVKGMAKTHHGLNPEHINDHTIWGKDHIAWVQTPESRVFNVGDAHRWRMGDMLRSPVKFLGETSLGMVSHIDPHTGKKLKKKALGDGVFLICKPETLGLPEGFIGEYQTRAYIEDRSAEGHPIVMMFKGIILIHPEAMDVCNIYDGYGELLDFQAHHHLVVWEMTNVEEFEPRARYTVQGLYYQGIEGWYKSLFSLESMRVLANEDSTMVEDRLIASNCPIKALGGMGVTMYLARMMRLTINAGKSRILLPACAFRYIKGYEHVAEIETELVKSHKTGEDIPRFYAPESQAKWFQQFEDEFVLNRRPDLPTGQCVLRFNLKGFLPFNAFVVPSGEELPDEQSLKLSGADFDGDMGVAFPTPEHGGLYLPFNDRSRDDRDLRLKTAITDRSATKKVFASGFHRYCGQLEATPVLGNADISARRFIDAGDLEAAWALQPWVQQAVDRQKYEKPWPDQRGWEYMPKPHKDKETVYMTDVLRALQKGSKQDLEGNSYERAWGRFSEKLQQVYLLAQLPKVARTNQVYAMNDEFMMLAARWGFEVGTRMKQIISELEVYRKTGTPLPHVTQGFADRKGVPVFAEFDGLEPEENHALKPLVQAVLILEDSWKNTTSDTTRRGWFNLKDAVIQVSKELNCSDMLAKYLRTYFMFRNFASVQQLSEYWDAYAGHHQFQEPLKRISHFWCMLDGDTFVKDTEHKVYYNQSDLVFGWFKFSPKCIMLAPWSSKHAGHREMPRDYRRGLEVKVYSPEHGFNLSYRSYCRTINDALVELRGRLSDEVLMGDPENALTDLQAQDYYATATLMDALEQLKGEQQDAGIAPDPAEFLKMSMQAQFGMAPKAELTETEQEVVSLTSATQQLQQLMAASFGVPEAGITIQPTPGVFGAAELMQEMMRGFEM